MSTANNVITGQQTDLSVTKTEVGRTNLNGHAAKGRTFNTSTSNNRNNNGQRKQKNTPKVNPTVSHPVNIETTNFLYTFHDKVRAAKYKVHAPNCDCSKVERIRKRYIDSNQPQNHNTRDNSTSSNLHYNNPIQFDIDGGFSQQFDELQVTDDTFDNLVVLPDTARPSMAYICQNTSSKHFHDNGTACEQKLAVDIFGSKTGDAGGNIEDLPPFKVACAICLLTGHYWNGFVALVSATCDPLRSIVQKARNDAKAKMSGGLHADHAHFVCILDISTLSSFLMIAKTRSSWKNCVQRILTEINVSGVEFSADVQSFISGDTEIKDNDVSITLGHHLTSFLQIMIDKGPNKTKSFQPQYLMVIGYQDGPFKWTLDLPGGKRHLGESTLEGAIREVEEECSLLLSREWLEGQVPMKYGGAQSDNLTATAESTDDRFVQVFETSGDAFMMVAIPDESSVVTELSGR
jgi:hypothetical protein